MWIRTQDQIIIAKIDYVQAESIIVRGYQFGRNFIITLGEYNSEAEALAVLDGIQEAMANMDDVFVMPEAGFLKQ